jgi:hypothetical protein
MTLAKGEAWAKRTFIEQASLTIVTYDHQNIFYSTGHCKLRHPINRRLKIQSLIMFQREQVPYFVEYNVHTSIMCT